MAGQMPGISDGADNCNSRARALIDGFRSIEMEAIMSAVHISLNVSNLTKSVDFYRGLFGEPKKLHFELSAK